MSRSEHNCLLLSLNCSNDLLHYDLFPREGSPGDRPASKATGCLKNTIPHLVRVGSNCAELSHHTWHYVLDPISQRRTGGCQGFSASHCQGGLRISNQTCFLLTSRFSLFLFPISYLLCSAMLGFYVTPHSIHFARRECVCSFTVSPASVYAVLSGLGRRAWIRRCDSQWPLHHALVMHRKAPNTNRFLQGWGGRGLWALNAGPLLLRTGQSL